MLGSALTFCAALLSTSACDTTIPPDKTAAAAAKQLMESACSAMISNGRSTWEATGAAVTYAEQSVEVSGGRNRYARNVTEIYFAANIADLYAASQRPSRTENQRLAPVRKAVSTVCKSLDPSFPTTWLDRGDES